MTNPDNTAPVDELREPVLDASDWTPAVSRAFYTWFHRWKTWHDESIKQAIDASKPRKQIDSVAQETEGTEIDEYVEGFNDAIDEYDQALAQAFKGATS